MTCGGVVAQELPLPAACSGECCRCAASLLPLADFAGSTSAMIVATCGATTCAANCNRVALRHDRCLGNGNTANRRGATCEASQALCALRNVHLGRGCLRPSSGDWKSSPIIWRTSTRVGFKQDVPTFQARYAEAIQQRSRVARATKSINNIGGGVKMFDIATDFSRRPVLPRPTSSSTSPSTATASSTSKATTARYTSAGPATSRSTRRAGSSPAKATSRCSISSSRKSRSTATCLGT